MANLVSQPLISFMVDRLCNLLIEEAKFLSGVGDQVDQMKIELNRMQCFLIDADRRKEEGDAIVTNWVAEIRELAYDAEDVIATFVIKIASSSSKKKKYIIPLKHLQRYLCLFKRCGTLHNVASQIDSINNKIISLRGNLQAHGVQSMWVGDNSNSRFERQQTLRRTYPHVLEEDVVGFENNVREVVDHLISKTNSSVVSIWGMGGLGKTTLAKEIHNHKKIRKHFDHVVWAYISQKCNTREVWEGILFKLLSPSKEEREDIEKLRVDELAERLYCFQSQKKCLVILDDIWEPKDWDSLSPAFPKATQIGSKMLLTTRKSEVALQVDQHCFLYGLRLLTEAESWELFEKKASLVRRGIITSSPMINLGKEMVRHCEGLPLAIVILGGLLATKDTYEEWEKVRGDLSNCLSKGNAQGGVWDVLALSYQDLPYHLKACFLYLSLFPEEHNIRPEKLIQMWMAEGFVSAPIPARQEAKTVLDVGMSYLDELVRRCMVQVQLTRFSKRVEFCRLHDLMRDLCMLKAREENFLKVAHLSSHHELNEEETTSSSSSSSMDVTRRIVIYYSASQLDDNTMSTRTGPTKTPSNYQRVRSCVLHSLGQRMKSFRKYPLNSVFRCFKLLKLLDLEGTRCSIRSELPEEIGSLAHLRYFSARNSDFSIFPVTIGNLIFLQTLDLRTNASPKLPNVLWKLKELRHLYLSDACDWSNKLRLDGLSKLETLENFNPIYCDLKCLAKWPNLRKLTLACEPEDLEKICESPVFSNANNLMRQSFVVINGQFGNRRVKSLLWKLLECRHLHNLTLSESYYLVKFPEILGANLINLSLCWTKLTEDPMPTLGKFANLRKLEMSTSSYIGKKMKCYAPTRAGGGFPQLQVLTLDNLKIVEWEVEERAMPNLLCLRISRCKELKRIPHGLRFVTTLQELDFIDVTDSLKDRIREGGEDFYKIQHVHSVQILTHFAYQSKQHSNIS